MRFVSTNLRNVEHVWCDVTHKQRLGMCGSVLVGDFTERHTVQVFLFYVLPAFESQRLDGSLPGFHLRSVPEIISVKT